MGVVELAGQVSYFLPQFKQLILDLLGPQEIFLNNALLLLLLELGDLLVRPLQNQLHLFDLFGLFKLLSLHKALFQLHQQGYLGFKPLATSLFNNSGGHDVIDGFPCKLKPR